MTLTDYFDNKIIKKVNIESSYHNHNYLCGHAVGTVKDYVLKAMEKGLKEIGISDHGYVPLLKDRMEDGKYESEYLPQFKEVDNLPIKVYKALELEYFEEFESFYGKYEKDMDYFILGQHYFYDKDGSYKSSFGRQITDEDIDSYYKCCMKGIKSKKFLIFAHPDLIFRTFGEPHKKEVEYLTNMIKCCMENNVLLEVNVSALRKYYARNKTERYTRQTYLDLLKKYHAPIVVSDDAHDPINVIDEYTIITYSYLEDNGFNIVRKINL